MGGLIAIGLLTKDHIVVDSDFLFIIIGTLVLPMIVFLLPRKDLPTTGQVLIIDGDTISFCFHQLQYAPRSKFKTFKLSRVRKVVDYGGWYFIYFKWNAIDFIGCQKDQILVGSIEEFEALFADKLVQHKKKHQSP